MERCCEFGVVEFPCRTILYIKSTFSPYSKSGRVAITGKILHLVCRSREHDLVRLTSEVLVEKDRIGRRNSLIIAFDKFRGNFSAACKRCSRVFAVESAFETLKESLLRDF